MSIEGNSSIRVIAVVAHGGAGKGTFVESMLYLGKAIPQKGSVDKANLMMFTEPEELARKIAITPHIGHLTWKDTQIYFVDTPGYFNFVESGRGAFPAVDGVVFLFSGLEGVKPESERLWSMVESSGLPTIGFVTQLDEEGSDLMAACEKAAKMLGKAVQPLVIATREGSEVKEVTNLLTQRVFKYNGNKVEELEISTEQKESLNEFRTQLIEKIAESNDELLEKYLEGKDLSAEELNNGLKVAVSSRSFIPVLAGSGLSGAGVDLLLDYLVSLLPSPEDRIKTRAVIGFKPGDETKEEQRNPRIAEPFAAQVIKTTIDPFSGKLSIIRVFSGEIKSNQQIFNSSRGIKQKTGHLYLMQGKELEQVERLSAGQIGAIAKLDDTHTGETVCDVDKQICFRSVEFPQPPICYAVESDGKNDEKIASGLMKLADEDPSLRFYRDEITHEMIVGGMGQTHIEVTLERLQRKFGAKAKLTQPRVPYRETIKKTVKVQGKLKKQTGGHGQFANCWLEVGPLARDSGFEFEDKIVGGVIPRQYIPSVEKGVRDSMSKGILGNYPVVDIRVAVYDGSYHDVDSSDYAFQVAGSLGFKAALEQAQSVLLEPIMALKIFVPEECTGDVMKDISGRRGRVLNLNAKGDWREIVAEAPMAEMLDYGHALGAMTSGRGQYCMNVTSYAEVPGNIATKVLEAEKAREAEKE